MATSMIPGSAHAILGFRGDEAARMNRELERTFVFPSTLDQAKQIISASSRPLADITSVVHGVRKVFATNVSAVDGLRLLLNSRYTGAELAPVLTSTARAFASDICAEQALNAFVRSAVIPDHEQAIDEYRAVVGAHRGDDTGALAAVRAHF